MKPENQVLQPLKLKVCGMKYIENIRRVLAVKPDYLGFIFYPKSSRFMEESLDPKWVRNLGIANKTGVFVNETPGAILEKAEQFGLNGIQLHGSETPDKCKSIRDSGCQVTKVFSVGNSFRFDQLDPYLEVVDYFLFDTKGPLPGGNGFTFNWRLLEGYDKGKPFFLSGGLNLENLPGLNEFSHPDLFGIDVNSGFEESPGIKEPGKLILLKKFLTRSIAS